MSKSCSAFPCTEAVCVSVAARNLSAINNGASSHPCDDGGANRDRTDDLKLAKLALSQLSYGPDDRERELRKSSTQVAAQPVEEWWAWEDLNFRPHAYQARALTN